MGGELSADIYGFAYCSPALYQTVKFLDAEMILSGKNKLQQGQLWSGLDLRDPVGVYFFFDLLSGFLCSPLIILVDQHRWPCHFDLRGEDIYFQRQAYSPQVHRREEDFLSDLQAVLPLPPPFASPLSFRHMNAF